MEGANHAYPWEMRILGRGNRTAKTPRRQYVVLKIPNKYLLSACYLPGPPRHCALINEYKRDLFTQQVMIIYTNASDKLKVFWEVIGGPQNRNYDGDHSAAELPLISLQLG